MSTVSTSYAHQSLIRKGRARRIRGDGGCLQMYSSMDVIEVSAVVRMMPQMPALYQSVLDVGCVCIGA